MKKWFEEYGTVVIVIILIVALIFLALFIKKGKQVENVADPVMSSAPISDEDKEAVEAEKEYATKETKTSTVTTSTGSSSIKYKDGQTWSQWAKSSQNTSGAKIVTSGGKTYVDVSKATGAGENEYNYIEIPDKETKISESAAAEKYVQVNVITDDKSLGTATGGGVVKQNTSVHLTATPIEGYELDAWKTTNGNTLSTENPYLYTASAGANIVATWKEQTATITYDFNDGKTPSQTDSINYLNSYSIREEVPTKEGYEFICWTTNKDGSGEKYNPKDLIKDANKKPEDLTLYAKWGVYSAKCIITNSFNMYLLYDAEEYTTIYNNESILNQVEVEDSFDYRFVPWRSYRSQIKQVIVEENFKDYSPKALSGFFYGFSNCSNFEGLENIDTSDATTISNIFYSCEKASTFNVSSWNVSNVKDFNHAFYRAGYESTSFNIDLSNWNISSATNINSIFSSSGGGTKVTSWSVGDLSNWDTSNLTSLAGVFCDVAGATENFDISYVSNWDVSNVKNFDFMFQYANGKYSTSGTWTVGDLSGWDTSNATSMNYMFAYAGWEKGAEAIVCPNDSGWNVENVTEHEGFANNTREIDVPFFKMLRLVVTTDGTAHLFYNTKNYKNQTVDGHNIYYYSGYREDFGFQNGYTPLSSYIKKIVIDETCKDATINTLDKFCYNLQYCSSIEGLEYIDTSSVNSMYMAFQDFGRYVTGPINLDLSSINTSNVTNMRNIFYNTGRNASSLNINVSGWDTSNVTNMNCAFYEAGCNSTSINIDGVKNWDTTYVANMASMFYSTGSNVTRDSLDLSKWKVVNAISYTDFNTSCSWIIPPEFGPSKAYALLTADGTLYMNYDKTTYAVGDSYEGSTVSNVYTVPTGTISSSTSNPWYSSRNSVKKVVIAKSFHDFTPKSIRGYFYNFSSCNTFEGLENINTSLVINMRSMFYCCALNAETVNIDLSSWDTSNCTDMNYLFGNFGENASTFIITGISDWDMGNIQTACYMFNGAGMNAKTWDVGSLNNWKFGEYKYPDIEGMFQDAAKKADSFTLDLSGWNMSEISHLDYMFYNAGLNAKYWSIGDLSKWNLYRASKLRYMFYKAGYNATDYVSPNSDKWIIQKGSALDYSNFSSVSWIKEPTLY